jgi:hypothetical protein
MAKLLYTESYIRRARKFIKKHPDLIGQYEKTLLLLEAGCPNNRSTGTRDFAAGQALRKKRDWFVPSRKPIFGCSERVEVKTS